MIGSEDPPPALSDGTNLLSPALQSDLNFIDTFTLLSLCAEKLQVIDQMNLQTLLYAVYIPEEYITAQRLLFHNSGELMELFFI